MASKRFTRKSWHFWMLRTVERMTDREGSDEEFDDLDEMEYGIIFLYI